MNFAFLPDLSALTILIVILLVLRRRHPQQGADVWLFGLFFTLVEAVAHTFYAPTGAPARALHVLVLDCYLLSGLIFTWASGNERLPRRTRFLFLALNGLPLLAIDTLYGLHVNAPAAYMPAIAAGLVLGLLSSLLLRRNPWLAAGYVLGWVGIGLLVRRGELREAIYWSLSCVYLIAGLNFQHRLPRRSTGRLAIVTGFCIWALCFMLHPWVVHYRDYADIASHVWNMQKSLISIGMLLVMLERQVAHNEWLALHDELTGLPNRRLFEDRMGAALRLCREQRRTLAICLLDLDGFKQINDRFGHEAGDEVLRQLARNLTHTLEPSRTLARLGGDEFVLIAALDNGGRELDQLTTGICHAIEKPIEVDGEDLIVRASLGISIYPKDAEDATRLLRIADQRMYLIKQRPVPYREQPVELAAGGARA